MDKQYEDWLDSRPPHVKAIAEKFEPNACYKSNENRGHYAIYSFDEAKDKSVTLKIVHGEDSYLPGIMVFGVKPESLIKCGCGKWKMPTNEQVKQMKEKIKIVKHFKTIRGN